MHFFKQPVLGGIRSFVHTQSATNSCVTNGERELEKNPVSFLTYAVVQSQHEVGTNVGLLVSESYRSGVERCDGRGYSVACIILAASGSWFYPACTGYEAGCILDSWPVCHTANNAI